MFLHKVNDFDSRSYISVNLNALIRMIEENPQDGDMDLMVMVNFYYGKFNDEQLNRVVNRVRNIINDKYKEYRSVKDIVLV
jgi:hypothetical protein